MRKTPANDRSTKRNGEGYSAEDVRQGRIVLDRGWKLAVFFVAPVLLMLALLVGSMLA